MGNKRPSVRTLPSGEQVLHSPDGSEVIIASPGLRGTVESTENAMREEDAVKTAARLAAVRAKRESLAAGDAVPDDKRVV